jgi:hypothetical protein
MRKILSIIFLFICFTVYGQTHIEYISEPADSMALISKEDIDVINRVFYEKNVLDSLHDINEQIISTMEQEMNTLDSIIVSQENIIVNDSLIIEDLENRNIQTVNQYSKELKKEKNKKISFEALTGASIIAIILLILL